MQSVTQTDCVGSLWWNVVVSKTKHSKTKTEARSTQISTTKHPKLESEAPKTRNLSVLWKHETVPFRESNNTSYLETFS